MKIFNKDIRKLLLLSILLLAYSAGVTIYLYPWAGVALAFVGVAGATRKTVRYSAHGTARWAEESDIPHLLEGPGLIIGHIAGKPNKLRAIKTLFDSKKPDEDSVEIFLHALRKKHPWHLVRLTRAIHSAVFAPSGIGKGVSCIVPFLLTCRDSCVVVDLKGENALLTAEHRAKQFGHKIVILDPYGVVTQ